MRECWWRHLSEGRLGEGCNAYIATPPSIKVRRDTIVLSSETVVADGVILGMVGLNCLMEAAWSSLCSCSEGI